MILIRRFLSIRASFNMSHPGCSGHIKTVGQYAPLTDRRISAVSAEILYGYSTLDVTKLAVYHGNQC
jgi:hypothetical protein